LFLVVLRTDGAVAYHDPGAGVFFHRYVLPLLTAPDAAGRGPRERTEALTPAGNAASQSGQGPAVGAGAASVAVWEAPGVAVAAFPYVEKRQTHGLIILAARSNAFALTEDVLRACSQLALDAHWLYAQAEELPAYGEE